MVLNSNLQVPIPKTSPFTLFGPPTKEGKGPTNSLPSVRPFVRPSGAFRKNHSLEFSEILHEGI